MRTQPNLVEFARPLIADVSFHHIFGEHVAFKQELMVGLECIEGVL